MSERNEIFHSISTIHRVFDVSTVVWCAESAALNVQRAKFIIFALAALNLPIPNDERVSESHPSRLFEIESTKCLSSVFG